MKNKRYFPMFIDLSDKKIVVVGGGNIATRRIRTLLQFTAGYLAHGSCGGRWTSPCVCLGEPV